MKKLNLVEKFPSSSPRKSQVEALSQISNVFNSGKKYAIARLPTGSGKSHIGVSVARSTNHLDELRTNLLETYEVYKMDRNGSYVHEEEFLAAQTAGAFILTVSKSLQDQYKNLFEDLFLIKGKNNYQCEVDRNVTVDFAPCLYTPDLKRECFENDRCPYYKTRKNALLSLDPILNYKAFFNLPPFLKRRQFFICDEAREINAELVSSHTITINYAQLQAEEIIFKKIISDDPDEAHFWVNDVYLQLKEKQADLKQKVSLMSKKYSKTDGIYFRSIQNLSKLNNLVKNLCDVLKVWQECSFIVEHKDSKSVTFTPCDVRPLAQEVFGYADKVLLMSATISNHEEYAKSLGINKNEYDFIDIPSTFDASRSPIHITSKFNLSYKSIKNDLPRVVEAIRRICELHKNEKGIIHTHTNYITEVLKKNLSSNDRFLFRELGVTNEDIVKIHTEQKNINTVLVSPSLGTGLSLDDDLGRFQIIVKAPFLPLDSKRIKKMFDKNPQYYAMEMLDALVQMCGRCTRSQKDSSITYILDASALNAVLRYKNYLPKDFLDRFL
jgi:Rad3-related DNA helicase